MVMLKIAYLSVWSYKGHVRYLKESKRHLFYLHATSKNEIHICSNKHETGLVYHHSNANIPRVSIGVHMGTFTGKTTKLFFWASFGDLSFINK